MKIFKTWSNWEDIKVRVNCDSVHYLLQMRTREDGKKEFKNRKIDNDRLSYILFHGFQEIAEKIIKRT